VHDDRAQVSSHSAQQAVYVHGGPGSAAGCHVAAAAAFSLRLAALVPDRIFLAISHNFSCVTTDLISSFFDFSLQAQFSFKFFSLA
jgi:hypothetical protein